ELRAAQIRNPKSETRNNLKERNDQNAGTDGLRHYMFGIWIFGFRELLRSPLDAIYQTPHPVPLPSDGRGNLHIPLTALYGPWLGWGEMLKKRPGTAKHNPPRPSDGRGTG